MQRPLFQKIYLQERKSFNILKVERPFFIVPWHFHPEVEIMLIIKGTGTRFVGDSIESFGPLDLVVVGSNLAHVWKNSPLHYSKSSHLKAEARVILFREDCFGRDFFNIPEMENIKNLLVRAQRGLKFFGHTACSVKDKIIAAYNKNELTQFTSLLHILSELSQSKEYSILSTIGYVQQIETSDLNHLNLVLDYLLKNFKKEIKLEEVSKLANMSPTAFCRYFKSRTNKTLIQFTNELRVGCAKKMLIESRETISTICFETGYNNISNFYDHFYKITGKRPSQFREEHLTKLIIE